MSNEADRSPLATEVSDCIGVLDLFGFENMEPGSENGFEQLCINYANEQLHHHFLREVIEKENQIYASEGLVMVESAFGNVDQLVYSEALSVLLGSRQTPGVFKILEDNCRMQQTKDPDGSFVRQVHQLLNSLKPLSPGKKRRKPRLVSRPIHIRPRECRRQRQSDIHDSTLRGARQLHLRRLH